MQKLYISTLFIVLVTVAFLGFATNFDAVSKKNQAVVLEWVTKGNLQAEEAVFAKSFAHAYKDIPLEVLKVTDMNVFLKAAFEDEYLDLNNPSKQMYCVDAKKDGEVIGFITFENTQQPNEVYIRQLAVDPSLWGQGVGTTLMSAIFEKLPDTKRIVLVTRKVNTVAQNFYKKLGFKVSEYIHEGLSPERYMGFELDL